MRTIKNGWVFLLSVLTGIGIVLCLAAYAHMRKPPSLPINKLTANISVAEQLGQQTMGQLKNLGFATVIDLRPDGEVADQPSSTAMSVSAKENNVKFYYVPVPHGEIPEQSVKLLADALRDAPKPVLMYCRSGRRAARTWSLVEASRPGGMDAQSIMAAVKEAGQSADDLNQEILRRIAQRKSASGPEKS